MIEVMKKHIYLNSDVIYQRRASTVSAWVHWFQEQLNIELEA